MIPIRDLNPTQRVPVITIGLIAANVLVFLLWQPTFGTQAEQQLFYFCHAEISWETSHQENLAQGRADAQAAIDADFGPGGRFVVTAGDDGNARIWEVATGRLLATLWGSPSTLMDVDFAPNGRAVLAAGFGDAARVYTCDVCGSLDDLLAFADRRVRRELSPAERALYLHERSGS